MCCHTRGRLSGDDYCGRYRGPNPGLVIAGDQALLLRGRELDQALRVGYTHRPGSLTTGRHGSRGTQSQQSQHLTHRPLTLSAAVRPVVLRRPRKRRMSELAGEGGNQGYSASSYTVEVALECGESSQNVSQGFFRPRVLLGAPGCFRRVTSRKCVSISCHG